MKSVITLLASASVAQAVLYPGQSNLNHTCGLKNYNGVLSCSATATAALQDSCCVETYGGLVLSTQFWDTYTGLESSGQLLPQDTWTLHGLWPDFCNGSYTQYCDLSRQYDRFPSPNTTNGLPGGTPVPAFTGAPISDVLRRFGKLDLLSYMNTYWIAQGQPNYEFWEHEFSKATCFSTFDTPCYGNNTLPGQDIIDFFQATILYYRRRPTWGWLATAGIRPSNTTTYSLTDMQRALVRGSGALPYIGCSGAKYNETTAGKGSMDNGRVALSEVWYYNYVYGRPQDGVSIPINATGSVSSCATTPGAIFYYVPTASSVRLGAAAGF